ncbi:MAG: ABC transporter substrate-binding protein, partial [Xanthobacteraceae bacterium]
NKPGGNATGTAGLTSELDPKRLEFLHAVKPSATLIGVLVNPSRPGVDSQLRELEEAGNKMGLKLEIQNAGSDQEINNAFQAFASTRAGAVLITADSLFNNHRTQVLSLAASYSLPAIYQWREFTAAGGLMSYGPSITSAYYHAGEDAGLILKGTKPTDIPVVQPERFELIINKKTAETLSLHIPETLLAAANEVIE